MSILIEAISVIVRNEALASHYPGGVSGYAADCPNHTFCSDGRLARIGFLSPRDVRFFVEMLESHGLVGQHGAASIDIAIVDQNQGPDPCCLWLDFGHLPDGTAYCWPAGEEAGSLAVPHGWQPRLLDAFEHMPGELSACAGRLSPTDRLFVVEGEESIGQECGQDEGTAD
jgi:hypothetical protein